VLDHLITKKIVGNTGVIREKRKSIRTENGEVLTTREMDILKLVARGLNNTEIADALCLSLGTVKNYITALYDKPGIKGRPKLMSFAIDNGLMGDGGST
jgi:DNA-binding NarL/FixJ family response regulator